MQQIDVALAYANAGFPIFPCHPVGDDAKKPLTRNGLKDATNDATLVARMWERNPDALIGLPTGERSGLWVLDLDMPKGDTPGGRETLSALGLDCVLGDAIQVNTRSGGLHAYFKHDPEKGYGNTAGARGKGLGDGIDTRSEGGYVIAPGSAGYEFANHEATIELLRQARAIPSQLVAALDAARGRKKEPAKQSTPKPAPASNVVDLLGRTAGGVDRQSAYAEGALQSAVDDLRRAMPGTRNHALNENAFSLGQLVGGGLLSLERVEASLLEAGRAIGLDDSEIANTAGRAIRDGMAKPRELPEAESGGIVHFGAVPLQAAGFQGASAGMPQRKAFSRPSSFVLGDGSNIPRRQFLFGKHYVRKYVSATISPGGVGKSSFTMAEALSMATGNRLVTSTAPNLEAGPLRVFVWNGEDPQEELDRRMTALALHHGIAADEIGDRLMLQSGRDYPLVLAEQDRAGRVIVNEALVDDLCRELEGVDVIVVDPFVSSHDVNENDNGAVDRVVKTWARIAERLNCAVELVHHSRKPAGGMSGQKTTDDDARGAGALKGAARAMRTLNRLSESEADKIGVDPDQAWRHVSVDDGKQNMAPVNRRGEWFRMASYGLANGNETHEGDDVGVVEAWALPTESELDVLARTSEARRVYLELLDLHNDQGRPLNPNSGQTYAPTVFSRHPNAGGITKAAFREAQERLLSTGEIAVETFGKPSAPRFKIVRGTPK